MKNLGVESRTHHVREILRVVNEIVEDYQRLVYLERCVSVLVAEHDNGGPEKDDHLIGELVNLLRGGPYERGDRR